MSARSIDVHAAGAVCWKVVDGEVRVLLVHRTQHKDVSLPKGKVDPGETLAETAQREILEETGLHIVLGVPLGKSDYRLPGGKSKRVHYWSAEVDPGEAERTSFEPNGEIAGLEWLNIKKAIKAVTYEHDGDILRTFETLFNNDRLDTFPVIVVRHGKALPPEKWDGPDWSRPLAHRGLVQAQDIAGGLAAFGPQRIVTSTASRCQATISPLSLRHEVPVKTMKGLSQDAYDPDSKKVTSIVKKFVSRRVPFVLCSHGPVIPQIVSALAEMGGGSPAHDWQHAANPSVGAFSVIHFTREGELQIVALESHEAPKPKK